LLARPGPRLARDRTWPGTAPGSGPRVARDRAWPGTAPGPGPRLARDRAWPGTAPGPGPRPARGRARPARTWHGPRRRGRLLLEAELVALRVLHDHAVAGDVVQLAQPGGAEGGQPRLRLGYPGAPLGVRRAAGAAGVHVQVHPVLHGLRLRYALEEQPGPGTVRVHHRGVGVPLLARHAGLAGPVLPGLEAGRRGLRLVAQGARPELRQLRRLGAVEHHLDPCRHPDPPLWSSSRGSSGLDPP